MTLKEVPTEILKESLLALADLRRKYERKPMLTKYANGTNNCPLCEMVYRMSLLAGDSFCLYNGFSCERYCPWGFVEGITARDFLCKVDDYQNQLIPDRLTRIDRWEAAINAELATREEVQP